MKTCFKCLRTLPLDDFYRHPQMADGHLNKCKSCNKADSAAYAKTARGRATARRRALKPDRIKYQTSNTAAWRAAHPEEYRAHNAVNNALRAGKMMRENCEVCGKGRAHAHHDDYSKPLEVRWLCALHHKLHHVSQEAR